MERLPLAPLMRPLAILDTVTSTTFLHQGGRLQLHVPD